MISLKINGEPLDLSSDIAITMKWSSPIFNTTGDYTYPFKIPATARNLSIIGWKHRIENTADPYEVFDATLEWNNIFILQGSLKIMKAQAGSYDATLFMNKGDFYYKRKNLSLQQVDFGEVEFPSEISRLDHMNTSVLKFHPEIDVCFPMIFDDTYFDPPTADAQQMFFNPYEVTGGPGFIFTVTASLNRTVIVPMLFLKFVIRKVFDRIGFTYDDLFFTSHDDYNKLVVYNSVSCNDEPTGFFKYPLEKFMYNYHVPRLSIYDFFNGLETFFNIRLFVNGKTKHVTIKSLDSVVKSTEYDDVIKDVLSVSLELEERITGYKMEMTLDSDDPTMDDLKAIDETNLGYIKDSVPTMAELPLWTGAKDLEIRFVTERNAFYRMVSQAWVEYDINELVTYLKYYYKVAQGNNITTKVSLLSDIGGGSFVDTGNTRDAWEDVPLKLFFLKTAPYEEGLFTSMRGVSATDNFSLFYNGVNGLFNKHFKSFIDFRISAKPVKITARLNYTDLQDIDFSRKYMINGTKYLLSEIQVSISNAGIKPATIKAYTCN